MTTEPVEHNPDIESRRAWLARSLWFGSVWASLRIKAWANVTGPLPWNQPVPLGRSGLSVTRLGFGCESAGDPQLIRRAAELGINHFNSFPNRGELGNFPVVGEALRPMRDRVILATGSNNRTRTGLLQDLDRQLQALGTDYVDLFYLLAVSKAESLSDDLLDGLNSARQAGKIRAGALSTHGFAAVLPRLLESAGTIRALMVTCNFAAWDSVGWSAALPDIRRLREAGIGVVAMKALMGGMGETPAGRSALAEALKTSAGRTRVMGAALRWILQQELVDTVPLLIASQAELDASTAAAAGDLNEDDAKLLAETIREARPGLCRLCPTCTADCRLALPVPEIMRALMYAEGYGDLARARSVLAELSIGERIVDCESCRQCTAHCPNGVQVRDRIRAACERLA